MGTGDRRLLRAWAEPAPRTPRYTPRALGSLEPRTRRRRLPASYPVRDALSVAEAAAATSPDKRVWSSGAAIRPEQRERRALSRKSRLARPGSPLREATRCGRQPAALRGPLEKTVGIVAPEKASRP